MDRKLPPGVESVDPFNFGIESSILMIVLAVNVLWYWIKFIVKSKGYPMDLFWGHYRDLRYMHEIIANETSAEKAKKYKALLYSLYFCFGGFILVFFI